MIIRTIIAAKFRAPNFNEELLAHLQENPEGHLLEMDQGLKMINPDMNASHMLGTLKPSLAEMAAYLVIIALLNCSRMGLKLKKDVMLAKMPFAWQCIQEQELRVLHRCCLNLFFKKFAVITPMQSKGLDGCEQSRRLPVFKF